MEYLELAVDQLLKIDKADLEAVAKKNPKALKTLQEKISQALEAKPKQKITVKTVVAFELWTKLDSYSVDDLFFLAQALEDCHINAFSFNANYDSEVYIEFEVEGNLEDAEIVALHVKLEELVTANVVRTITLGQLEKLVRNT